MNHELIKSISDVVMKLRPLVFAQFVRPIKELEKHTFPPGYIQLMRRIKSFGLKPVSMTDVSTATYISKPNLTIMIDRLCTEGFVERSADENDRRIVNIALTQLGLEFLSVQQKKVVMLVEDKLSTLSEYDVNKLRIALENVTEVIKKIE